MRVLLRVVVCVVALAFAGVAVAGDPFEDARYYMGIKNNAEAIKLIDSGQFDINMQTDEGYTLLHYAADNGNLEMVRELIRRGADVNLRSARGSTPWDMAITPMVKAEIAKAGGRSGLNPQATAPKPAAPAPAPVKPAPGKPAAAPAKPAPAAPEDARRKMCNARHYSSSSLCSDSTCKMREYRKWQTCLQTGSYY